MKRLLILVDDQLIANFYREKFQALGIAVDFARTADAAVQLATNRSPDLALIDPVLPPGTGIDLVTQLREAMQGKPVVVFTHAPDPVARLVKQAGVTRIVPRSENHGEAVVSEVQALLGLGGSLANFSDEDREAWVSAMLEGAPEAINEARVSMHAFIKEPQNCDLLFDLFRQVHHLSERTSLVGLNAVYKMTVAIETFLYDLYAMPEQVNPSVIRTMSQSIDFLATLLDEKTARLVKDPSTSDVLVVEDESETRKLIASAMEMVNLKITCAAESEMAMSILEDNPFDLVFLDINLPQTSGFDICTQVRQLEDHKTTPIVFLTGLTTFQNRAKSALSGGNDFIAKPFNVLELGVKALTWVFRNRLQLV
ncbi:MAG: two-component system, OmpR family, phosphate regulon response regulator PhoB [Chthoniobacter sp.]|nr:two-component system, OmpR family, phosphate regulon response regulator PhoB [Chthoniobacter sp.]